MNKYIKKINIGNIEIKNNVFLAPMAGITDRAYRKLAKEFGAGLTYTEMASSRAIQFSSKKTEDILEILEEEKPSVVQIFGHTKEDISYMINYLNERNDVDIIDINMGCPAPKLVKNGDGSGLLKDLDNVKEILTEAIKVSKKPVTVKTRIGINGKVTAIDLAKMCEEIGISAITIHGRTREQYYSGVADLDIIKQVKEIVKIPVIGNGDITDIDSMNKMFEYTKCDAVMIGRAAIGKPYIFKELLENKNNELSKKEILNIMNKHIDNLIKYDGIDSYVKFRKHAAFYLKGIENSSIVKNEINKAITYEKIKEIIKEFLGD